MTRRCSREPSTARRIATSAEALLSLGRAQSELAVAGDALERPPEWASVGHAAIGPNAPHRPFVGTARRDGRQSSATCCRWRTSAPGKPSTSASLRMADLFTPIFTVGVRASAPFRAHERVRIHFACRLRVPVRASDTLASVVGKGATDIVERGVHGLARGLQSTPLCSDGSGQVGSHDQPPSQAISSSRARSD